MGNNLLASNERKGNKNTELLERKIKTRKTESQQCSLGTSDSPKEARKAYRASFPYEVHISVMKVHLALSGESIDHLVATSKTVKIYSNGIKS